jgi:hypothetical protein
VFACCVCCVLSGRGLSDELITHPEDPIDCGASLCVIKKPRGRGHSPRWAAELKKIIIIIIVIIIGLKKFPGRATSYTCTVILITIPYFKPKNALIRIQ